MGETIAKTVIQATGLPQEPVKKELEGLAAAHGKSLETLTLEELREVMADYLQTVFLELQEDLSA